jgi:predicted transcriptional regulator
MVKKRERLEIIRDILTEVNNHRKIGPTKLLYSTNLSPQMFKEYIEELLEKTFIEEERGDRRKLFLTLKGKKFLKEYLIIENTIKNFGL